MVGIFSVLNMPSGTNKYCFRVHRVVILPDFQGLGFGTVLLDWFGEYFTSQGLKLFIRSSHVRLAQHCRSCGKYKETGTSQKIRNTKSTYGTQLKKYSHIDFKRAAYSFEYVGEKFFQQPHQIIIADSTTELAEAQEYLNQILKSNYFPIIVTNIADQANENAFEQIAKKKGIRTEVLWIKRNGVFELNTKRLNNMFDAIALDKKTKKAIQPYRQNINSLITYWKHDLSNIFIKINP